MTNHINTVTIAVIPISRSISFMLLTCIDLSYFNVLFIHTDTFNDCVENIGFRDAEVAAHCDFEFGYHFSPRFVGLFGTGLCLGL